MKQIPARVMKQLFYLMLKIRRFEEKIIDVYPQQEMKSPVHLYIGEEAIAAGVCINLRKEDYIFSTHRNHGHYLAKGADMKSLMAELYGKINGCSKGKGGSMHPVAPDFGILGTTAIVGGGIALATGVALASKMKKDKRVTVAFFGDGAVDEGTFHESLNFASLKKLPVVFICENNFYATNSHQSARQPQDNISLRAAGYGIGGIRIDGNDVLGIYETAKKAIDMARSGLGPTLIECRTYRWKGHVGPECDYEKGCRPKQELEEWMEKCPVEAYKEYLLKNGVINQSEVEALEKQLAEDIEGALRYGQNSPYPSQNDLLSDVYYTGKKG